jgi:hypothetical protein
VPGKGLTRREFEEVIRRATEFAAEGPDDEEGILSESEVLRIASEVGLAERHVRRALSEVRDGTPDAGMLGSLFGPATVRASRLLPRPESILSTQLDEFLVAGQLLQPVRRSPGLMSYRPAVDWASQIARAASATSKRYYMASAKHVEIRLEQTSSNETMVQIEVDPGTRNDHLIGAFLGGGAAGIATGVAAAVALTSVLPLVIAVGGGLAVGATFAGGIAVATGRAHRKRVNDVRDEVEGVLDRLETGGSLEPPPPSWRRWVRRHFHGVARDLRGDDE